MATIVSSTEFRSRMGAMLALADKGEQVVIKRRSSPSYALTAVAPSAKDADSEEDNFFTPEMLAEIDRRYADYLAGKNKVVATFRTHEDVDNYFESLCTTK